MYDIEKLNQHSEDVKEYIESNNENAPQFMNHYNVYKLDPEVVTRLKCHSIRYTIYAFSAEWCPDCHKHIPVLARIQEETGLKTRILGHLMREVKSSTKRWRVPPSPAEVEEFNLVRIPSMYILDKKGNKVGEIIEHPPAGMTLEAAVLKILES